MDALFLLGRLIYGGLMIWFGLNHFRRLAAYTTGAGAKGVPAPRYAVLGTGLLLIGGGLSILLGLWVRVGVALLLVFFVGVTFKMHAFWADSDPAVKRNNMNHFLKNSAMAGAALMFLAIPLPWPLSIAL